MSGDDNLGHSRQSSLSGHYNLGYDAYDTTPLSLGQTTAMSRVKSDNVNVFIIFVFILELLVLVFVSVLEYFLRATDVFPVRKLNFTCHDADIRYSVEEGEQTYMDYTYKANVPYKIIIPLCFCIPPAIILISELALWAFSEEEQKTIQALCAQCKLPQIFRRMVRYIGSFLFGLLITMIFVDVTKMFIGRLRPNFLDICKPDITRCKAGEMQGDDVCTEKSEMLLRDARMSFPSLHAAMTAFAAGYLAVYLHHVIRASSVRIMRPFLALGFIILSVMCSLARYGLHYSHWTDVMVGFGLGIIFSVYICVFVLNNFREHLSSRQLYQHIRGFMYDNRHIELQDMYKEQRLPQSGYRGTGVYAGGVILPRPQLHTNSHINESTTDDNDLHTDVERVYHPYHTHSLPPSQQSRYLKKQSSPPRHIHDTFQRDLHRTIDIHRQNEFGRF